MIKSWIVLVCLLDVLAFSIGIALYALAQHYKWFGFVNIYLSVTTVFIALITFFGFVYGLREIDKKGEASITQRSMRHAITASVLATYLVVIGLTIFFSS